MQTKRTARLTAIAAVVVGVACTMLGVTAEAKAPSADTAIRAAAKQNRYAFVTFFKSNDSASKAMLTDIKSIQGKYASRANFISVNVGDKANRQVVSRYGADRSPIPLTLVIAPNGAITGGFPREIDKSKLSSVFVSKGTAAVLKVMQNRKLAAICLQNSKTKHNKECLSTARGIKSDSRLGGAVEIVKIDPSDRSESKLLKQLGISNSANAQLVVMASPGRILGKFDGTASKASVMASLMKSMNGGGCSGGSCGPGGCK